MAYPQRARWALVAGLIASAHGFVGDAQSLRGLCETPNAQGCTTLPPASASQRRDPNASPRSQYNAAPAPAPAPRPPVPANAGFAGIGISSITAEQAQQLGLGAKGGVLVQRVAPYLPAEAAGLQRGDIITHLQGARLFSSDVFYAAITQNPPRTALQLVVERRGQSFQTRLVTTVRPPEQQVEQIISNAPVAATPGP